MHPKLKSWICPWFSLPLQKVWNLALIFDTTLSHGPVQPPPFWNESTNRYQSFTSGAAMTELSSQLGTVWSILVWRVEFGSPPLVKEIAKSSITHPGIVRFRSNLAQGLTMWHPVYCKCSRSRGQGVKVTAWRMDPNLVGDCSTSPIFCTDFGYVTPNVLWMFKVNGSKVRSQCYITYSISVKKSFHFTNR